MTFAPPSLDESACPWTLPRMEFTVYPGDADEHFLAGLEDTVPGLLSWMIPEGWRPPYKKRLRKLLEDPVKALEVPPARCYLLQVPLPGGWLVEDALRAASVSYASVQHGVASLPPSAPVEVRALLSRGLRAVGRARARGLLAATVECAAPFQVEVAARIAETHAVMEILPAGSGKTLATILGIAARAAEAPHPRGALVVCPARARPVWSRQWSIYTGRRAFRLLPPGAASQEDWPSLSSYLEACRCDSPSVPLVVVGSESSPDRLDEIHAWCSGAYGPPPSILVFDEIHEIAGDARRFTGVARADGTVDFALRLTSRSGVLKRTAAAMVVSRYACFDCRVSLSATPLGEGLPRRLYGPLDVTWPGVLGMGYSAYASRYCGARMGRYAMEDAGASNVEELRARCSFLVHEVPYSVTHAGLPPLRVEVDWLDREDLEKPDAALGREVKAAAKANAGGFTSSDSLVELQLAGAAARKRGWVVSRVVEALRGGPAKVVVFSNRHDHVERWAVEIAGRITRVNEGDAPLGPVEVRWGHGDCPASPDAREAMASDFADHPGPCVYVLSGQAFGASLDGFQHADLAILAALPWKADDLVQWRGRFDRHGGRATLVLVPLARGTYDESVALALSDRLGSVEAFLSSEETRGLREKFTRAEDAAAARRAVLAALGLHDLISED